MQKITHAVASFLQTGSGNIYHYIEKWQLTGCFWKLLLWKGEKHFQELGVWWLSFIVIEERMRELCSCSSLIKDLLEKLSYLTS